MLQLRHQADVRTVVFLLCWYLFFAIAWFAPQHAPGREILLIGILCHWAFVACIIKHNQLHCGTFRSKLANRCFGVAISIATGQPSTGIITAHNRNHHEHLDSDHDFVRSYLVQYRLNILNLATFAFASVSDMFRNKPNDLKLWKVSNRALYKQALLERFVTYGLLTTMLLLDWRKTLLFYVLPSIVAQWSLITMNLLQHQFCDINSKYNHSRNITGKFLNWIYLNNGFHTAHHLKPGLHWSALAEFHYAELVPYISPELNVPSLHQLLWQQFIAPPESITQQLSDRDKQLTALGRRP